MPVKQKGCCVDQKVVSFETLSDPLTTFYFLVTELALLAPLSMTLCFQSGINWIS